MIRRIEEIRKCLDQELYEAALALALTLPDICGQIEYPNTSTGERYRDWIKAFVDDTVFYDPRFEVLKKIGIVNPNQTFEPLTAADIYKLRCHFLHCGDDDIESSRIDKFQLVKPGTLGTDTNGKDYGYRYGSREERGQQIHFAELNIKYICEMFCMFAEKYYDSRNPEDFEDHTWTLE